jgi:hypothetical protein
MADSRERTGHPDLTGYLFGLPGGEDADAIRAHVRECRSCAREVKELGGLPGLMAEAAPPPSVPAGLERRVLEAVGRDAATGTGPAEQFPVRRRRPAQTRSRLDGLLVALGLDQVGRRLWGPGIAVAAAAMLVLALAGVEMARLGPGPGAPGAAQPAVHTVKLVAADGSGASGTASVQRSSGGQVVELRVAGLPETSPGELYVCWLVDEGDSLQHQNRVAVGTFRVSGPGPVTVRWSTGADTEQYRMDVTREQADGNPLRRGPEVLVAAG